MPCDERESGGKDKMELGSDGKTTNMLAIAFRPISILNAELNEVPKTTKLIRRNEKHA